VRFGDSKRVSGGGGGAKEEEKEGGGGSTLEDGVEIAMLISTLVILGTTKGKQGEDGVRMSGWEMEKGVTYG